MAGTFRRAMLVGAALLGVLSACGQAVDHAVTTSAGAPMSKGADTDTSPGTVVVPNPPPNGGYEFGSNPDVAMLVGNQPLTSLQRRTVGNIQLRLFTAPTTAVDSCTPNSVQCIPPWCASTSALVAEVSNDAMASVQAGSIIGLAQGSQASLLNSFVVGAAEQSPVLLVMVKVADDIGEVRLTADGGSDAATPVEGLAVLAAPNSTSEGTVTLFDKNGRPHGSLKLPQPSTVETPACAPGPVPLPKAGVQPADPAAAEKAVRAAYTKAFTAVPGDDSYSSLNAVQNGAALHGALDHLRQNFAQAAASSSVELGQLVFTDPQTAVLKFTLHYTGGAPYGTHNGTAVLENGTWLVSQDSYCAVLAFGGAACPGR